MTISYSFWRPKSPQLLASLAACCWTPGAVQAWNAEGHMLAAQVAYAHLEPAAKSKCDTLLGVPLTYASAATSNFVTAACWADDFKSQLGSGTRHYLDLPFSLDGTSTNGVASNSSDVVQAINESLATLLSLSAEESTQATSLRYLLHFAADIHQPLHSSTAVSAAYPGGDAGGNTFYLNGTWNNLHSLWDAGGGYLTNSVPRPLSAGAQAILNAKVAAMEAHYPYLGQPGALANPMDWALDGRMVAQSVCYVGVARNGTPSSAYLTTAQARTEQRLALAGHRLADLLNTLFAPPPLKLVPLPLSQGRFGLSWAAVAGRTYSVRWKLRLSDSAWTPLTTVAATSNSASFSEASGQTSRYYTVTQ